MLTLSWKALLFIGVSHFIFDRWPIIIKRLIWFKNHLNPQLKFAPFKFCDTTGYYDDSPYNSWKYDEATIRKFGQPRIFISVGAENPSPFRGWDECDSSKII